MPTAAGRKLRAGSSPALGNSKKIISIVCGELLSDRDTAVYAIGWFIKHRS